MYFFNYRRHPPSLLYAESEIQYKYNNDREMWVLVANYTCAEEYEFLNSFESYYYCKDYKWIPAGNEPTCIAGIYCCYLCCYLCCIFCSYLFCLRYFNVCLLLLTCVRCTYN